MYLEDLIAELRKRHPARVVPVGFSKPHSYRGDYSLLAFEPTRSVSIGSMLAAAESALGATFEGYKGGTYRMHAHSDCHLAKWGDVGEELGPRLLELMLDGAIAAETAISKDEAPAVVAPDGAPSDKVSKRVAAEQALIRESATKIRDLVGRDGSQIDEEAQGILVGCDRLAAVLEQHDDAPLEKCEGCALPATTHDVDGVPLCTGCMKSLKDEALVEEGIAKFKAEQMADGPTDPAFRSLRREAMQIANMLQGVEAHCAAKATRYVATVKLARMFLEVRTRRHERKDLPDSQPAAKAGE